MCFSTSCSTSARISGSGSGTTTSSTCIGAVSGSGKDDSSSVGGGGGCGEGTGSLDSDLPENGEGLAMDCRSELNMGGWVLDEVYVGLSFVVCLEIVKRLD